MLEAGRKVLGSIQVKDPELYDLLVTSFPGTEIFVTDALACCVEESRTSMASRPSRRSTSRPATLASLVGTASPPRSSQSGRELFSAAR